MKKRRALVLKGGTMQGAFIVGALKTFSEKLPADYFDAIYATSVGVFEQAFFASGQTFFMENTWREYVHGRQLVNFLNPLRGRAVLDLEYLTTLFQSEKSMLDIEAMKNSRYELKTFALEYDSKEIVTMDLKKGDVFQIMKATCAVPYLYPYRVMINGKRYVDSWIAPNEQFGKALKDALKDYDEVIAIVNNTHFDQVLGDTPDLILKPTAMPLKNKLDTNKERLIATIEQGKRDALNFVEENKLLAL